MSIHFPLDQDVLAFFLSFFFPDSDSTTPIVDISRDFGLIVSALAVDAFVYGDEIARDAFISAIGNFHAATLEFGAPKSVPRDYPPHLSWTEREHAFVVDVLDVIVSVILVVYTNPDHFKATYAFISTIAANFSRPPTPLAPSSPLPC